MRNERVTSWFGAGMLPPDGILCRRRRTDGRAAMSKKRQVSSRKPSCLRKVDEKKRKIWLACPEESGLAGIPPTEKVNGYNHLHRTVLVIYDESKQK
jgi:hypothetical protein